MLSLNGKRVQQVSRLTSLFESWLLFAVVGVMVVIVIVIVVEVIVEFEENCWMMKGMRIKTR